MNRTRAFVAASFLLAGCASAPEPNAEEEVEPTAAAPSPSTAAEPKLPSTMKFPELPPAPWANPPAEKPALNADGWWRDSVFYEIFVRSFRDSNGDGIGDFVGLTEKLDYLNDGKPETTTDLGVDAVWLMPIHPSPSYHGYDVTDYRDINPEYGTLEEFDAFLKAAHERGIRVIIDYVINHASVEHPWFKASGKVDDPKRHYFVWTKEITDWSRPWDGVSSWHQRGDWHYYGLFWSGMPDWNMRHPDVAQYHLDSMRFWLKRGVDGFRVDAARYLIEGEDGTIADHPDTHEVVRWMRRELSAEFPGALFVAESWTNLDNVAAYYGDGDEFQLAFNFDIAGAIRDATQDGTRSSMNQALRNAAKVLKDRAFEAPFMANHDMPRVFRHFGADWAKMRIAVSLLMAMPGTPFLYYGEEIGMQGGEGGKDEEKRTPFRWTSAEGLGFTDGGKTWYPVPPEAEGVDVAAQLADEKSLWHHTRKLIDVRHGSPALRRGTVSQPKITGGGRGAVVVLRETEDDRMLAVYNLHTDPSKAWTIDVAGTPEVVYAQGLNGEPKSEGGKLVLEPMAPQSFAFIRLK